MTQISKRWLLPDVEQKIRSLLVDCIARCRNQQVAANFVDVLLTDTEKLMIAKRISIALMLIKGYSAPEIDEKLKVSLGTIYAVKAWLDAKGSLYRDLLVEIAHQDEAQEKKHESLLDEARNSTPRWGINWREAKKKQWRRAEESKVPF